VTTTKKKSKTKWDVSVQEHADSCEVCYGKDKFIDEDYYTKYPEFFKPEVFDQDIQVDYVVSEKKEMNMSKWIEGIRDVFNSRIRGWER